VLTQYRARNAIVTTSWIIFEVFRDLKLLDRVRGELDLCRTKFESDRVHFDIDKLLRQPVLQAVYAETLRLRMHFYIIRMSDKINMNIRDWVIPRQKVIVTSTTSAHLDAEAWNTGPKNEHPVNKFWAERFLRVPMDTTAAPTFSTKELEGLWIPYGGGPRQCPGRHFAKRQILLTTALMVTLFDCEVLGAGTNLQEDLSLSGFGGGISKPASKVPIRLKRRDMDRLGNAK
jgi:cytochrome P450